MHIEPYGSGERTVVAVHGWGGTHRDFAAIAGRLPPEYRMLGVDLPGCGETPPPKSWSIDAIVEPLEELLADLDDPDVTMLGFCSGAYLALLAASRSPGRVRKAVLIDPMVYVPWYFALFAAGEFGRRAYHATFVSPLGRRLVNRILQRRQRSDADFTAAFVSADHETTLGYLRVFKQAKGIEPFVSLRLPVDVCCGEHTFAAVRSSIDSLREALPQLRVTVLSGAGHLPLVRKAREIAAIVAAA